MPRTIMRTSFKVKTSIEGQGITRSIIAETENMSYVPNGEAYELQNRYGHV